MDIRYFETARQRKKIKAQTKALKDQGRQIQEQLQRILGKAN